MKQRLVNVKRAIMANDESAEVAEPSKGGLHGPPSFIAARSTRYRMLPVASAGDRYRSRGQR